MKRAHIISRKLLITLLVTAVLAAVLGFLIGEYEARYPKSEWHSRHDCHSRLANINHILLFYLSEHGNIMPADYEELFSKGYLRRREVICPSQQERLRKAGLLEEDSPLSITSYRLKVPGQDFIALEDGTIVVEEYNGNHPACVEGGQDYLEGYHVLVKDGDFLQVRFFRLGRTQENKHGTRQPPETQPSDSTLRRGRLEHPL